MHLFLTKVFLYFPTTTENVQLLNGTKTFAAFVAPEFYIYTFFWVYFLHQRYMNIFGFCCSLTNFIFC